MADVDVVHLDLWAVSEVGPKARIEFVGPNGEAEAAGSRPLEAQVAGAPVSLTYVYPAPGQRRILLDVAPLDPVSVGSPEGFAWMDDLLSMLPARDRATATTYVASGSGAVDRTEWARQPTAAHRRALRQLGQAEAASARSSKSVRAAAPFLKPEGDAASAAAASDEVAIHAEFLAFAEAQLLARRPQTVRGGASVPRQWGELWFGTFVALDGPLLPSGPRVAAQGRAASSASRGPSAVHSLPAVLHRLFVESVPEDRREAASSVVPREEEAAWAAPRFMAFRDRLGAAAFRRFLRDLVESHDDAAALDLARIEAAAEEVAPDFGGRFMRAWMHDPARPKVQTQWRHDASRERLLLRVDQIHELDGGRVSPAFPFDLPVRIVGADGTTTDHLISIEKRRDLIELPCAVVPEEVLVDPGDRLGSLVDFSSRVDGAVSAPR